VEGLPVPTVALRDAPLETSAMSVPVISLAPHPDREK
jgi:hypothetical protein